MNLNFEVAIVLAFFRLQTDKAQWKFVGAAKY